MGFGERAISANIIKHKKSAISVKTVLESNAVSGMWDLGWSLILKLCYGILKLDYIYPSLFCV